MTPLSPLLTLDPLIAMRDSGQDLAKMFWFFSTAERGRRRDLPRQFGEITKGEDDCKELRRQPSANVARLLLELTLVVASPEFRRRPELLSMIDSDGLEGLHFAEDFQSLDDVAGG